MKLLFSLLLLVTSVTVYAYDDMEADSAESIAIQESDPSAFTAVWIEGKGEQLVHQAAIGSWGPCQPHMFSKKEVPGGRQLKWKWLRPGYDFRWSKMDGGPQCRTI